MIIWLNGAFGSGKTTLSHALHKEIAGSCIFDPEETGTYLRNNMPREFYCDDYQDLILWREINYKMIKHMALEYKGTIIIPMTMTSPVYFREIVGKLRDDNIDVRHFTLLTSKDTLHTRLKARGEESDSWAHHQIHRCLESLSSPLFEQHIHTDEMSVDELVEYIKASILLK